MKKSIIIPSITILSIIVIVCLFFLGTHVKESMNWSSGVFIETFSEDKENEFLATYGLDKYDYVKLSDVYYKYNPLDPYYIISFKVSKVYVEEFENLYLSEYSLTGGFEFSEFFPNRDYGPIDCKAHFSYEHDSTLVYVKEHDNKDYYEYHIRNFGDMKKGVYDLIREQFYKKNYKVIGKLKYDPS